MVKHKRRFSRRQLDILALILTVIVFGGLGLLPFFAGASSPFGFASAASQSFAWVGNSKAGFTEGQLETIAHNNRQVVFTPWHAGYNISEQETEVRRLKVLNPSIKVYLYFNSKHFLIRDGYIPGFDEATMALHGTDGKLIPFKATADDPNGIGDYVDESSPTFRQFASTAIHQVVASAHYDGVALDSFRPLFSPSDAKAMALMSTGQINNWNAGQQQFLQQLRSSFPNKAVLYNGISQQIQNQVNRDLGPLPTASGALNEQFCLERSTIVPDHLRNDIALMSSPQANGKILLEKSIYSAATTSADERDRLGDFCYAAFLMGYQPGYTFFNFAPGYSADQLAISPPELGANLGDPTGPYAMIGNVARRTFQRGEVFTNLGTTTATLSMDAPLTLMLGGSEHIKVMPGAKFDLAGLHSAFLVSTPFLHPPAASPTPATNPTTPTTPVNSAGAPATTAPAPTGTAPVTTGTQASAPPVQPVSNVGYIRLGWDYLDQSKPVRFTSVAVPSLLLAVGAFWLFRTLLRRHFSQLAKRSAKR